MAHRSQKIPRCLTLICLLFAARTLAPAELRFEVRHERILRDHAGVLTFDDAGVAYQRLVGKDTPAEDQPVRWRYADIQQLWISPDRMTILTYEDRKWLLGADRQFEFFAAPGQSFEAAYEMLKDKLDQRLVAALADPPADAAWELPAKLLGSLKGSEGTLRFGPDRIVYETGRKGHSRTWRYGDIENISSTGPFQLTITARERAKVHYGSLKGFNFQLKQPLDEQRFDTLWRQLHRSKGLRFLTALEDSTRLQRAR